MKEVKHPKIIELDTIDFIAFQFKYIFYGVPFNDMELKVLAYVYLYKDKAIDEVVSNQLFKRAKSVENMLSKFRKLGVVTGRGNQTRLHKGIRPQLQDIRFTIEIKLNESNTFDKVVKEPLERVDTRESKELLSSTV